jgi:hypothetical protein
MLQGAIADEDELGGCFKSKTVMPDGSVLSDWEEDSE